MPEFNSSYIPAIAASVLEKLFNQVIAILAQHNFFPKKLHELLMPPKLSSQSNVLAAAREKKRRNLVVGNVVFEKSMKLFLVSRYRQFGSRL